MAAKEFIVAIELGSSKMTGIAGQKNLDGSITVLAVVKEEASSFIRKGVVYNIDKTAQCDSSGVCRCRRTIYSQRQERDYKRLTRRHHCHSGHGHRTHGFQSQHEISGSGDSRCRRSGIQG